MSWRFNIMGWVAVSGARTHDDQMDEPVGPAIGRLGPGDVIGGRRRARRVRG